MEYTDIELKNEQWRDVDGYDGAYQVSDLGRVRSHKSGEWKVMRFGKINTGYFRVQLWRNGQGKWLLVHRLVAEAFIENTDSSKTIINHIDECKQNNRAVNLEYCTASYNNTYNDIHLRRIDSVRDKVKYIYNPNLSYKQNLEIFRANGIECSTDTILRLRKDLGLSRQRKKPN